MWKFFSQCWAVFVENFCLGRWFKSSPSLSLTNYLKREQVKFSQSLSFFKCNKNFTQVSVRKPFFIKLLLFKIQN